MEAQPVIKEVLKKVKPSKKEEEHEITLAEKIKETLEKALPKNYSARITGSVAKGTFLKNSADLDIFILVPKNVKKEKLPEIVKTAVKKAFPKNKNEVKYAEHPYVRLYGFDRKVDIVPAYDITFIEERASAVDRSILHTGYIKGKIKDWQKDEVRLLKQFLKVHDLYGAEIRVQGFSGYLCELLIIKYGDFISLLKSACNWSFPIAIDIEKYYQSDKEIVERFRTQNITVVDPVDKNRDVSAIVSDEVIYRFIVIARKFIRKPSKTFFERKEFDSRRVKSYLKRHANLFSLSFNKPEIVDDILWGQLRKLGKRIVKYLEDNDFTILDYHIRCRKNKVVILLESLEKELPNKIPVMGPQIIFEKHVEAFKKVHRNSVLFIKNGRMIATEDRRIMKFENALKEFIKNGKDLPCYLQKNIKNSKISSKADLGILKEYFFWRKVFRE
ncbi:MAG: CCA tRNA nucleotidyltransferase [Candidatus ainarchaeum sp.]|nr:CCA tRNA nucleotidyltransferase [Candidatus ainarchaeum sp.]